MLQLKTVGREGSCVFSAARRLTKPYKLERNREMKIECQRESKGMQRKPLLPDTE